MPLRAMVSLVRAVLARPSMLPEEVSPIVPMELLKSPDVVVLRSIVAVPVPPDTTVPLPPLTAEKPGMACRL